MNPTFFADTVIDPTTAWLGVITIVATALIALSNVILQVIARIDSMREAKDAKARTEEVKSALFTVTADQNTKIAGIATGVQAVHSLANSMQDKLVAVTESEALARGAAEEKARSDTEKRGIEKGVEDARVADLKKDIERVPEKTAVRVVDKLNGNHGGDES